MQIFSKFLFRLAGSAVLYGDSSVLISWKTLFNIVEWIATNGCDLQLGEINS